MSAERAPGASFRARVAALASERSGRPRFTFERPGLEALAQLNRALAADAGAGVAHGGAAIDAPPAAELRSARRFRAAWSRIAVEARIDHALRNPPPNPGPLNSEMLLLRALAAMRALSPAYTYRFLSQVDAALWLDARPSKADAQTPPGRRRGRRRG